MLSLKGGALLGIAQPLTCCRPLWDQRGQMSSKCCSNSALLHPMHMYILHWYTAAVCGAVNHKIINNVHESVRARVLTYASSVEVKPVHLLRTFLTRFNDGFSL